MIQNNKHYKRSIYRVLFPGTHDQGVKITEVTFALGHKGLVRCESEKAGQGHSRTRQGEQDPEISKCKPGLGNGEHSPAR